MTRRNHWYSRNEDYLWPVAAYMLLVASLMVFASAAQQLTEVLSGA